MDEKQELNDGIASCIHAIHSQDDFDYVLVNILKLAQDKHGFGRDVIIGRLDESLVDKMQKSIAEVERVKNAGN